MIIVQNSSKLKQENKHISVEILPGSETRHIYINIQRHINIQRLSRIDFQISINTI